MAVVLLARTWTCRECDFIVNRGSGSLSDRARTHLRMRHGVDEDTLIFVNAASSGTIGFEFQFELDPALSRELERLRDALEIEVYIPGGQEHCIELSEDGSRVVITTAMRPEESTIFG